MRMRRITMVYFNLHSGLKKAFMKIKRGERTDLVSAERPFYRDVLEVSWLGAKYTIVRSGVLVRNSKIYKEGEYLGAIREKIGLMTHFDVFRKAKKVFEIHESESLFKQEFQIAKGGKNAGRIRSTGVYIPILSNLGKGVEGEFFDLEEEEEEILLLSIFAISV